MKDLPSTFLQDCSGAKIKHIDISYTSFESPGNLLLDGVTFMSQKDNERILWEEENGSVKDLPSTYYIYIYKLRTRSLICLIWLLRSQNTILLFSSGVYQTKNGQPRDSPSSVVFFLLHGTPNKSAGEYKVIKNIRVEIRHPRVEKKPVKNHKFDERRSSKTKIGKSAFLVKQLCRQLSNVVVVGSIPCRCSYIVIYFLHNFCSKLLSIFCRNIKCIGKAFINSLR